MDEKPNDLSTLVKTRCTVKGIIRRTLMSSKFKYTSWDLQAVPKILVSHTQDFPLFVFVAEPVRRTCWVRLEHAQRVAGVRFLALFARNRNGSETPRVTDNVVLSSSFNAQIDFCSGVLNSELTHLTKNCMKTGSVVSCVTQGNMWTNRSVLIVMRGDTLI